MYSNSETEINRGVLILFLDGDSMSANRDLSLVEILEKILNYTSIDDRVRAKLRPGLSRQEIQAKVCHFNFPFSLPQEVEELYQWHDGFNLDYYDCQLFDYHTFVTLDEALETWKSFQDDGFIQKDLLPLFTFEGEWYCIQVEKIKQESGQIWFVYHDDGIVYDSLKAMLFSILECYEVGAYQPILKNGRVYTEVDREKVAEVKLKYNRVRQQTLNQYEKHFSGDFYDHP